MAAQSICYLGVKPGRNFDGKVTPYGAGTAFFVGPTTLITAAHLVPDNKRRIVAQLPGTRRATSFVENLFNKHPCPPPSSLPQTRSSSSGLETFECKCLGTGLPNVDIAILEVLGPYIAPVYLAIDQGSGHGALNPDDFVDIIGYPGIYNERYIQSMHHGAIDGDLLDDVFSLFPKSQLVITYGPVVLGGIMPTYRVSTVSGMSGSPVIVNGKVRGISRGPDSEVESVRGLGLNHELTDGSVVGIHIGANSRSTNRCVSFAWKECQKLLEVHGLIGFIFPIHPHLFVSLIHPHIRLSDLSLIDGTSTMKSSKGKKKRFNFILGMLSEKKRESSHEDQEEEEEQMPSQTQIRQKVQRMSSSVTLDSPY